MGCLSEETVIAFASGTYPASGQAELERHLNFCDDCHRLVAVAARSLSRNVDDSRCNLPTRFEGDNERSRLGDFELLRVIGRGGMGIVYEARNTSTRERVALKTVRPGERSHIAAMRREIRALQRVPHPGVVRIRPGACAGDVPFYVMDFIDGPSLARMLGDRTMLRDKWPTILRRVCTTLTFLHRQGIVHRDLTPRNIVLRGLLEPVMVDFGLASYFPGAVGRDMLDMGNLAAGTIAYVAPEQIRGELVDARADLYSLGCILYELLTGRPPFIATDPRAVLRGHLYDAPIPPSELAANIPRSLDTITLALLSKQSRTRPGYAEDLGSILGAMGGADWESAPLTPSNTHVYRPGLVGRENWQTKFRLTFERCLAGRGSRLFIAGEPGAGKTRLITEAIMMARRIGLQVIAAEGSTITGSTNDVGSALSPQRGSSLIIRELVEQCAVADLPTEGSREEWQRVLVDLQEIFSVEDRAHHGPASPSGGLMNDATRAHLLGSFRQLLVIGSAVRPMLLVIDDLHWTDPVTLDFLRSLPANFFESNAIVLVASYRPEEADAQLAKLLNQGPVVESLERLDLASTRLMLADMLALDSVPSSFIASLSKLSQGTPFFIAEYVRMAVAARWLTRDSNGRWNIHEDLSSSDLAQLSPSAALTQLISRRLELLPSEVRALVDLAAVLGRNLSVEVLARAHRTDETTVIDALNELTARQVLEPATPASLRFVHDQVRSAAYEHLPPETKLILHRRVAEAIETSRASDGASMHAELAYHWSSAGELIRATTHAERAGEHAFATGAYPRRPTRGGESPTNAPPVDHAEFPDL